jgi:hypothetical protein
MDKNQLQQLIRDEIAADKQKSQYGVTRVPFHTHNNLDSPSIHFRDLSDVPSSYTPYAGYSLIVNPTQTGLIYGGKLGKTGPLFDHYATVGNVTTGETDLYSDSIPASTLASNGDKLEIGYAGSFVSSGTATREIKIYFGGTQIFDTGALTLSLSSAWTAYVEIIRVSATSIRYMVSMTTEGAALAAYTAVGEVTGLTLTNANVLKITGQAAGVGAATNDITALMGYVLLFSAA